MSRRGGSAPSRWRRLLGALRPGAAEAEAQRRFGTGVWRRVHDRFRRAVDRYHQVIEPVADGPLRDALERGGARLARCLDQVAALCEAAQRSDPSTDLIIPSRSRELYARLSRAATLSAQAAEAAAMARVAADREAPEKYPPAPREEPVAAGTSPEAVGRAVAQVEALVFHR